MTKEALPAGKPAWSVPPGHRGVGVALVVVGAWGGLLAYLLFTPVSGTTLALLAPMTFLYTGLFITAHDAMHGLVSRHRPLNDAIGQLCAGLYALFSFRRLRAAHALHHARPAGPDDPDWHDGRHAGFWRWYGAFMRRYVSIWQLVGMAVVFNGLHSGLGVPLVNVVLCWGLPNVLSTLQLFAFGTYRVHREPPGGHLNRHRASSDGFPGWLSFLSCYHFGRHLEHHAYPSVPWWRLSRVPPEAAREESQV